jgi:hypothetical protein
MEIEYFEGIRHKSPKNGRTLFPFVRHSIKGSLRQFLGHKHARGPEASAFIAR